MYAIRSYYGSENPDAPLPEAANFRVYEGYDRLPESIRARRTGDELPDGEFVIVKPRRETAEDHAFVYGRKRPDGVVVYFVYSFGPDDKSENVHSALHST